MYIALHSSQTEGCFHAGSGDVHLTLFACFFVIPLPPTPEGIPVHTHSVMSWQTSNSISQNTPQTTNMANDDYTCSLTHT